MRADIVGSSATSRSTAGSSVRNWPDTEAGAAADAGAVQSSLRSEGVRDRARYHPISVQGPVQPAEAPQGKVQDLMAKKKTVIPPEPMFPRSCGRKVKVLGTDQRFRWATCKKEKDHPPPCRA